MVTVYVIQCYTSGGGNRSDIKFDPNEKIGNLIDNGFKKKQSRTQEAFSESEDENVSQDKNNNDDGMGNITDNGDGMVNVTDNGDGMGNVTDNGDRMGNMTDHDYQSPHRQGYISQYNNDSDSDEDQYIIRDISTADKEVTITTIPIDQF